MKRYGLVSLIMLGIFIITAGVVVHAAEVRGTRHDLSAPMPVGTGPGPIRSGPSGGTSEICVFCHTPHGAAAVTGANAPLWNKNFNVPGYQLYTSDVLTQLSYPAAEQPLPSVRAVHLKSRLCLTCHDGTIALGNLANWPSGYSSDIPMSNAGAAITTMPTTAEGYIGVDLRDDHPVAIQYTNSQDPELAASPAAKVKVFSDGTNSYVECTSCHDPHDNTNPPFLVDTNAGSALCTKCHSGKAGFSGSIHDTSPVGNPPPPVYNPPYLGSSVGGVKCMNCHYPHKAGVLETEPLPAAQPAANPALGKYLLALQEEMTCYNVKNRWGQAVSACHGAGGYGLDIKSEVLKGNHRVENYTANHEATEHRDASGNAKYNWVNSGGSWHVECDDCHNSHTAKNINHIASGRGTNVVGIDSPLKGAGGVSVSFGNWPAWPMGPGTYTYIEPQGLITTGASTLQYEYEICLKCHSDFAWGNNPPSASTGGFGPLTNQALEFGMNSTSFHPVAQATGRTAGVLGGMIGMLWTPIGMNTMFCSDCHTKEGDGMPTGSHGSIFPFNLRNPFTDQYGGRGGGNAQKQPPGELCFDCHDQNEYWDSTTNGKAMVGTGFYQNGTNVNLHTQHAWRAWNSANNPWPYRCVNCHSRVPHGYYRKALIVLDTDAPPYVVVPGKMSAYNPMPAGYVQADCTTVPGCHIP